MRITGVDECKATDHRFYGEIAAVVHSRLAEPDTDATEREKIAVFVRRMADIAKRGNPYFSFEWFYGACGLDLLGDLHPPFDPNRAPTVRWDPDLNDFRRI